MRAKDDVVSVLTMLLVTSALAYVLGACAGTLLGCAHTGQSPREAMLAALPVAKLAVAGYCVEKPDKCEAAVAAHDALSAALRDRDEAKAAAAWCELASLVPGVPQAHACAAALIATGGQ